MIGYGLEQRVELLHAEALADIRLRQALAVRRRKAVGALDLDGVDGEAAGVFSGCRGLRRDRIARQLAEFIKTALLLLQQAILTIADHVLLTRGHRQRWSNGAQTRSHKAQPHREVVDSHHPESLVNINRPSLAGAMIDEQEK